jgi:hypothetical protein
MAQASEFSGNTCNNEGANCQTRADWLTGWCEAAVAAGAVEETVEECKQSVGANNPDNQGTLTERSNAQQQGNSNAQQQGSSNAQQQGSSNAQQQGSSNAQQQGKLQQSSSDAPVERPNNEQQQRSAAQGGGAPGNQQLRNPPPEKVGVEQSCRYYIVKRSDPDNQICVPY